VTTPKSPGIAGILETVLYVADLNRAERFYVEVMGLRQIGKEADRHVFFRVGTGVLLLFLADRTRKAGTLPAHGAHGEIHVCLRIDPETYDPWRKRIASHGLAIERDMTWPNNGRSFYFRDPDGNLLELADADIWPR